MSTSCMTRPEAGFVRQDDLAYLLSWQLKGTPRQRFAAAVAKFRERREGPGRLMLILADLDRFKLINELCGPGAGDIVLDVIASRCKNCEALTLQMGDDEFACVTEAPPHPDQATEWAKSLQRLIAEPISVGRYIVHLTASIGLVIEDESATSADEMLRAAWIALSHAKAAREGGISRFRPQMFTDLDDRAELEDDFRSGLLRGEILPYYQPIVTIDTSAPKGYEALLRWQHPRQGLLGPGHILPVAGELGLEDELLFMVMRRVCKDARAWPPHFTVSINMSPSQLSDPGNAMKLLQILFASGLAPSRLIVEITEEALIRDLAAAHETIRLLRGAGAGVAMDDFGNGYASLSRLCNLELDHIKIDRAFVHALDGEAGRKLVKAIVDLGRSLAMPVTAEGIETPEQAAFLKNLDCAYGQGFLYGRPAPASSIASDPLVQAQSRPTLGEVGSR